LNVKVTVVFVCSLSTEHVTLGEAWNATGGRGVAGFTGGWPGAGAHPPNAALDFANDRVEVGKVARRDHRRALRAVPLLVEPAEHGGVPFFNNRLEADGQALRVQRILHEELPVRLRGAPARITPHAHLLQHRPPLVVHVGVADAHARRELRQNRQRFGQVFRSGVVDGHEQLVHGLVHGRVRVLARAELGADALQEPDDLEVPEVLRRAEREVLHEVRHAALVLLLRHRADVHGKRQRGAILRLLRAMHVVPHAVGQDALPVAVRRAHRQHVVPLVLQRVRLQRPPAGALHRAAWRGRRRRMRRDGRRGG
jgi:hypothetical protein